MKNKTKRIEIEVSEGYTSMPFYYSGVNKLVITEDKRFPFVFGKDGQEIETIDVRPISPLNGRLLSSRLTIAKEDIPSLINGLKKAMNGLY